MPIALVIIGAIMIVVAWNNTQGQLATALGEDIPAYFKWAIAIAIILALGYAPGLQRPSRWLLALVMTVLVVTNYQAIVDGISEFAGGLGKVEGKAAAEPTAGIASSPATAGPPSAAEVAGLAPPGAGASPIAEGPAPHHDPFDPSSYLALFGSIA